MRERICSHQPVSHDVFLHPALGPRDPCPGLKMWHGVPKPPVWGPQWQCTTPTSLRPCNFGALSEICSFKGLQRNPNTTLWSHPLQLAPPQTPKPVTLAWGSGPGSAHEPRHGCSLAAALQELSGAGALASGPLRHSSLRQEGAVRAWHMNRQAKGKARSQTTQSQGGVVGKRPRRESRAGGKAMTWGPVPRGVPMWLLRHPSSQKPEHEATRRFWHHWHSIWMLLWLLSWPWFTEWTHTAVTRSSGSRSWPKG